MFALVGSNPTDCTGSSSLFFLFFSFLVTGTVSENTIVLLFYSFVNKVLAESLDKAILPERSKGLC